MSQILRLNMIGRDLLIQRHRLRQDPPAAASEDVTSNDSPRAINRFHQSNDEEQASPSMAAKMGLPMHREPVAISTKVNLNDVLTLDSGENYSQIHIEHDSSRIILAAVDDSKRKEARIFIPNGSEATLILEDGQSKRVKRAIQHGRWVSIRPGVKLKVIKFPANSDNAIIERTFSIVSSSEVQSSTPSLKMASKKVHAVYSAPSKGVRKGIPIKETKHVAGMLKDADGTKIPLGFSGGLRSDGVYLRGNGKPIYTTLSVKPDESVFDILVQETTEPGTYSIFILTNNFAEVSNNKMSVRIIRNHDDHYVRSRQWTPIERGDKINIKIISKDGLLIEKNFTLESCLA